MIVEYGRELRHVEWDGRASHNFLDSRKDEVNLEYASDTTAKTRIYHVRLPRLLHRQSKSEVHWADTKLRPACLVNLFHRVHTVRTTRITVRENHGLPGREGASLGRRISGLRTLYWC
jgi:hypothetical protein